METGYLFPKLGQKPWSPPNTPPQPQVHHHLRGHCHPHKCMHTQTHSGTHTCTHTATGLVELLSFYPSCPVSAADPSSSSPPHGKGTDLSTLQCSPFPCCPPWCKPGLSCGGGEWVWSSDAVVGLNKIFVWLLWFMGRMTFRHVV